MSAKSGKTEDEQVITDVSADAAEPSLAQQQAIVDLKLRRTLLWLARLVLFAAFLFMLTVLFPLVKSALATLSPFIVALVVAYIFNPVVRLLQSRLRLGRAPAMAVTYVLILLIAAAVVGLLVPVVFVQTKAAVSAIVDSIPVVTSRLNVWLQTNITADDAERLKKLFKDGDVAAQALPKSGPVGSWLVATLGSFAQTASHCVVSFVQGAISGVTFFAFTLMISAYFLLDYTGIWQRIGLVVIPRRHHARAMDLVRKIDRALGGYLRGQLTVCLILSVLYSLVLMALGMRSYAVLIGLLAGFGNLIPYFGPIIGAVPTVLWIIFSDYYGTPETKCFAVVGVGVLTVVLQSLDGWIFQPRIVGANAELPPLFVLFALIIGAQFGLTGLILAVPTGVVARVLLVNLWWRPLVQKAETAGVPVPKGESDQLKTKIITRN